VPYTIRNLACGDKTSDRCVNIDWSIYLRLKRLPLPAPLLRAGLNGTRMARLARISNHVRVHDLRKGIPGADSSADAVYHSHFLEHLDRAKAPAFLREIRRVLKPGGIQRVVVPDFSVLCRRYLEHLDACRLDMDKWQAHEGSIAAILEHMVREEAFGTSQQGRMRRAVENLVLGSARRRGETHRWMYDEVSLSVLLQDAGFTDVTVRTYQTSGIPGWAAMGLDSDGQGGEYKRGSCYVECRK